MLDIIITCLYGLTLGLTLSVDTFMLSLVYGTTIKRKSEILITGIVVGVFHFIMLYLGYYLATIVFAKMNLIGYLKGRVRIIAFIALVILGLMMLFKKDTEKPLNIKNFLTKCLFALSVSIDSFLVGVAITVIHHIYLLIIAIIIAFISCFITLVALILSNKTKNKLINFNIELYAGIIIIILAIVSLFI